MKKEEYLEVYEHWKASFWCYVKGGASTFTNDFISQTDLETAEIVANMSGHDGQEGLDAFINKRTPDFMGKR